MKRILLAALAALTLLVGSLSIAFADDWCSDDPPVRIATPSGRSFVVKVTDYALGTQHAPALKLVSYSYVAAPTLDGSGTDVLLTVNIPDDALASAFPTRSVVSTAADDSSHVYQAYSIVGGASGTAIVHHFTIPVR